MVRSVHWFRWGCAVTLVACCGHTGQSEPATPLPARVATRHLPNTVRIHSRVYAGGSPEGPEGFAELAALGVRTLVSVDGAKPDVELARAQGLKYIHLPHGYDGIAPARVAELAKAVSSLDGPIYIHCHHGKHRSPAAGAAACVAAGLLPREQGTAVLKLAGTSEAYAGLYQAVERTQRLSESEIDGLAVDFQSSVAPPPLVESMVELERLQDRLTKALAADVFATANAAANPVGNSPAMLREASLLLREQFTEMLRQGKSERRETAWQNQVAASERLALELERLSQAEGATTEATREKMQLTLAQLSARCRECHAAFRDQPQAP